ncbi:TerD family protein [Streptomyces hoynatensis]|uniref:TerD family protein n=1 Tax=Streptomyces hoynatensis TaxID=1141874 RepID=A0A3A9ZEW0_9ACTN|nr:TerD family protein [Streptomyces hoynatensis]RKN45816.1 TerD family protein [Streptomyces hoynatensis]
MTRALDKGATIHLPDAVRAVLRWARTDTAAGAPGLDLSALLLDAEGRVRSEGDFVFYNQPRHPTGLVRKLAKRQDPAGERDTVHVDLARLDAEVTRVVLAASVDGADGFPVAQSAPRLLLRDATGGPGVSALAVLPLRPAAGETAVVCGECVRRDEGWEFRAVGQGYAGGLVALAADFGIRAAGAPAAPPRPAAPPAVPAPPPDAEPPAVPEAAPAGALAAPQPDPGFTLPPQGPQFLPTRP